jgi:glycosyltransferase involved in cell wall biosynthesis
MHSHLNLYNGQVFRGAESWVIKITSILNSKNIEILLLQGGLKKSTDPHYVRSVNLTAKDYSGERKMIKKLREKLHIDPVDMDVNKFYRRSLPHLKAFKPDFIFPINQKPKYLRNLLPINAKLIGVAHGGIPEDVMDYDAYIGLSKRDLSMIRNYPIKQTIIPNGVDITGFKNISTIILSDYGIYLEKKFGPLLSPKILVVASLQEYKRVNLAIQALGKLKQGTLLISGDGNDRHQLELLANSVVDNKPDLKVIFLGTTPYSNMPLIYNTADIFTHPANSNEAFGSVIIEAMAAGLPVLVNDDEVRRTIVPSADFLVDPTNIDNYAKGLLHIYENKSQYNEILDKTIKKFDWNIIGEQYINFLETL